MQIKREKIDQLANGLARLIDFSSVKQNHIQTARSFDLIPGGMWICKIEKGILGLEEAVAGPLINIKSNIIPKPDRFTLRKVCAKLALANDYLRRIADGNNP